MRTITIRPYHPGCPPVTTQHLQAAATLAINDLHCMVSTEGTEPNSSLGKRKPFWYTKNQLNLIIPEAQPTKSTRKLKIAAY